MQADDGQIPNKKRRRTNKEKNNRDDITEGTIGDGKKKRSRKVDDENEGDPTTQNKTDYGTNPTNKDFLWVLRNHKIVIDIKIINRMCRDILQI